MKSRRFARTAIAAAGACAGALAVAGTLALAAPAGASTMSAASHGYRFTTIDNEHDLTFNQLLGINGSGSDLRLLRVRHARPPEPWLRAHAALPPGQLQERELPARGADSGDRAERPRQHRGLLAEQGRRSANFGFYTSRNGAFHVANFLTGTNSSPQMDQLLGINDHGMAVGFYANQDGNIRGYEYNIHTGVFKRVVQPGVSLTVHTPSLTAAAINNYGAIAGFYVTGGGVTDGFVRQPGSLHQAGLPGRR